jgi:hypothetical protein
MAAAWFSTPQTRCCIATGQGYLSTWMDDYQAAVADIARAADLEPEAARLPRLRCDLYARQGEVPALLAAAHGLYEREPGAAAAHFYLALGEALDGQEAAAYDAMQESARLAGDEDRREQLAALETLSRLHPAATPLLNRLAELLAGGSDA